ncbi:hypothetical protein [Flavobacterium sp. GT3R68]|uniref:hypothetical protein n=1 Tax=Flavobacterium sp. GT3R68 TaxID=2594437 RepID=UPI000F864BE2|nr:hypothetical protein [Flavobacterium sp. GT3R68]RTY93944.1 hypothetical protein EKL32_13765 [Flavobacterium sp. GSN2]TRW93442.1 hypothetical protein FNW07_00620 [Flavobacterium sp. GT3R68]
MKKVLLLCLLFILSNSIYAQETAAEKKARIKTEKEMAIAKKEAALKTKEAAPKLRAKIKETGTKTKVKTTTKVTKTAVPVVKETTVKVKAKPVIKETKVKVKAKTRAKFKETNERAPSVPDKVTGQYNGKKVYTGPRGGRYYINSNGNKTYIED